MEKSHRKRNNQLFKDLHKTLKMTGPAILIHSKPPKLHNFKCNHSLNLLTCLHFIYV